MKCISIRQPWASLIIQGFKDVENRTWATKYRGPVLIHASKKWEPIPYDLEELLWKEHQYQIPGDLPLGAILGSVNLTDVVETHPSPWFFGPIGFILENPVAFAEPIPAKGQLGIYNVSEEMVKI